MAYNIFKKVILNTICNKTVLYNTGYALTKVTKIYGQQIERNNLKKTASKVQSNSQPADEIEVASPAEEARVSSKGVGIFNWMLSDLKDIESAQHSFASKNIVTTSTTESCAESKQLTKTKIELASEVNNTRPPVSDMDIVTATSGVCASQKSSGSSGNIFNWIFKGRKESENAQNCVAPKHIVTNVSAENCAKSKQPTENEIDLESAVKSELPAVGEIDKVSVASGVCAGQESNGGSGNIFNWILSGLKDSEFAKHCVASKSNIATNVSAENCAKFKKPTKTEIDFESEVKSTRPTASDMVPSASGGYTSQKTSIFDWMLSESKQTDNTQNCISSNNTTTTESSQNCVSQHDSASDKSTENSTPTTDTDLPLFHLFF